MIKKLLILCGLVILVVYFFHVYSNYKTDQEVTSFYQTYKSRPSEIKSFQFVDIAPIRNMYAIHVGKNSYSIDGYTLFDIDDKKQIKWVEGAPKGKKEIYEPYIIKFIALNIYAIGGGYDTTGILFVITHKDKSLLYLIDSTQIGEHWMKEISDRTDKSVLKLDGQWYYIKYQ